MTMTLIKAETNDKEYLLELRKLTMGEHLENAGVHLSDSEHLVRIDEDFDRFYIIASDEQSIGAVKYHKSTNKLEIIQFQIHPRFQGRGLGTRVLNKLFSLQGIKTIELSVLKENLAKQLYLRLGFQIIGENELEYYMRLER